MAPQSQREGAATTCPRLEDVDRACRNEQHRFPRYWEAPGALLGTRSHRLSLRFTVAPLAICIEPFATSDASSDSGRARDRRQPPLAAATSPGTSRPHLRRTRHRHAGIAITGIPSMVR